MIDDNLHKLRVLDFVDSPENGRLLVVANPLLGLNIITDNKMVISGKQMGIVWKRSIQKIKSTIPKPSNCLFVGFGVGSGAYEIKKTWPEINLHGIEIDPLLIELGQRYFNFKTGSCRLSIIDFFKFRTDTTYDLIVIDLFRGSTIHPKVNSTIFLKKLAVLITPDGTVLINLISENKTFSNSVNNHLKKLFKSVRKYPVDNNQILVCRYLNSTYRA